MLGSEGSRCSRCGRCGRTGRQVRSCRAESVMAAVWIAALCAVGSPWRDRNGGGGGSLEEQKLAGEIEKGQEEGDTELNRPIQRQRQ